MNPLKYSALICTAACLLMAVSCTDKGYDFSQLDTTMNFGVDCGIVTEKTKVGKLLHLEDVIEIKESGDYYIRIDNITPEEPEKAMSTAAYAPPIFDIDGYFRIRQKNYFELPEFPDFFVRGSCDLCNYVIMLDINNAGLEAELELDIAARYYAEDGSEQEKVVHIGANDPEDINSDPVIVPREGGRIYLSHSGRYAEDNNLDGIDIKVDLMRLLQPIPYQVALKEAILKITATDWTFSQLSEFGFSYFVEIPLAFGRNLDVTCPLKLENLGESLSTVLDSNVSLDLNVLNIACNVENTLPLGIGLDVRPLDKEGNYIEGLGINIHGAVCPGSENAVSVNPVTLEIFGGLDAMKQLDGLEFSLNVNSNEEVEGIVLNENQWVRITDVRVKLKGDLNVNV